MPAWVARPGKTFFIMAMIQATQDDWQRRVPRPSVEFPRKYLPSGMNLSDWHALEPYLGELRDRRIADKQDLLHWIADYAEFSSVVGEESSRQYIAMTCDTRDEAKEKAYLHFVEEIEPKLAPELDALNQKLIDHPLSQALPDDLYGKWRQSLTTSVRLFHPKNVPLQTKISKLSQEYQKISGEMTVDWDGESKTLSQLAPYLQSSERSVREKAWRKGAERRSADKDKLDDIFDEMLALRSEKARHLGLPGYIDFAFQSYLRTDYGSEDCLAFHKGVETAVVPLYREMMERRRRKLGLETLRPWDLSCDPQGRAPLKPFKTSQELMDGVENIFQRLDPELAAQYRKMRDLGLMDLENRAGKAPGGYQSSLSEVRLPFIFMNSVGMNEDVFTLLHESGHAFHYFSAREMDLDFNRHAAMEFSEVASMGMERLAGKYLDEFYSPAEKLRALAGADEDVIRLFPWVATVDAFQFWLYSHPHDRKQRERQWLDLDSRFGANIDWSGLEEFRGHAWQKQLHIFEVPFYYIEYGIAQLGALQVWQRSLLDESAALRDYKSALRLGGTRGLRDLFQSAGIQFGMDEAIISRAVKPVWDSWRAADDKGA